MELFCSSKINLLLLGFVVALVIGGGGNANADFIFGTPTNLGPTVNSSANDGGPSISADGLSLFFQSRRADGFGGRDLWVATRGSVSDPWGTPVNLGPTINTPVGEYGVSISSDGLSLYFDTRQSGASGAIDDLWVATRATTDDDWRNPVNLGPTVNSSADDRNPDISADDLALYFNSNRPGGVGGYDLWVTTRETIHDPWGTPVNLGPTVNSSANDGTPGISADGRTLFFTSWRPGGYGGRDIWVTRRATTNDDWGEPVNLGSTVNSSAHEFHVDISGDSSTLYFTSDRPGGVGGDDLWQVSISPVVDFNGDGRIDFKDFSKLAQYWLQDESLVDIAPPPLGDDMVDFKDIAVFAENWLTATTIPPLPAQASNPHPYDYARGVDINADLSWTAGSRATSHDVYFGTSNPPPFIGNQTAETFDPCTMAEYTIYYWRIDQLNGWGKTTGQVWAFTTMGLEATVPNGDFELIYKPGTGIPGVISPGGSTEGVGPDAPMDSGTATYFDGTTGDWVDIPGWIGADPQGWIDWGGTYGRDTNFPNRQGAIQPNGVDGSYCYLANGGDWGNSAGGLIVSEASLGNVEGGIYVLSMYANANDAGATPVVLELLAGGTALTPTSSVDPDLSAEWQEYSRTYDADSLADHLGKSLRIMLGVGRGAIGTQTRFDNVTLSHSPE